MSLRDEVAELRASQTNARVLIFDIETQRAVVETFSLFDRYTHIDRVVRPARILCFSALWRGSKKATFRAAWRDDDEKAYERMVRALFDLLDRAHVVVTWNGDRFDMQWCQAEFARYGLGRPSSFKSVDLYKVAKRHHQAGLMSLKLDWSARHMIRERKLAHGGTDLWSQIRYGSAAERCAAQKKMREYCVHDTFLTAWLLDSTYLPWTNVNMALYADNAYGALLCTRCGGADVRPCGYYYASAYAYQEFRCAACGSISRGRRSVGTTALRAVP